MNGTSADYIVARNWAPASGTFFAAEDEARYATVAVLGQTVANALSIPFIPADTSKPNYTVDHSGNLAVIGPDGTQRGFIRAPLNNVKLVAQLPVMVSRQ